MTKVFHEMSREAVDTILQRGLLLGTSGDKTDSDIARVDTFLNKYRPVHFEQKGVDRKTNNYCYLSSGECIIDITSGEEKSLKEFMKNSSDALLQVEVDPTRCYISDLDIFDQIVELLRTNDIVNASRLASVYWSDLQLMAQYGGNIRRPEVILTYNVSPSSITQLA